MHVVYFIFVDFRLFPVLDLGLSHYASEPSIQQANSTSSCTKLHSTLRQVNRIINNYEIPSTLTLYTL